MSPYEGYEWSQLFKDIGKDNNAKLTIDFGESFPAKLFFGEELIYQGYTDDEFARRAAFAYEIARSVEKKPTRMPHEEP